MRSPAPEEHPCPTASAAPGRRRGRSSTRLDNYVDRYAARTQGMTASEIRALFSVASRPEVVSLAGGMPNISGLPLDVVGGAISDLVQDHGATAMQYGSGQGDPVLREQICDVMRLEGIEAHPDDVVVTVGSQQAVDLVTRIFCDPGDVVICEAPSYVGALGVFRAYECDVVHVEMDAARAGALGAARGDRDGAGVRAGRSSSSTRSRTTTTRPASRSATERRAGGPRDLPRGRRARSSRTTPTGCSASRASRIRALRADEADGVIYLGSFSKTFAPGFRVGWALAPHAVREKLVLAQESATLCPPAFSQMAISAYLRAHDWQGQVKQFREMYRERRDAMVEALDDLMPAAARWNVPDGGFYVWLTLPDGLDAKAMLPRAVTARVAYVPGTAFFADGFGAQSMRLSYCYPTPERIREGVRRLVGVIEEELELRETFGAGAHVPSTAATRGPTPT